MAVVFAALWRSGTARKLFEELAATATIQQPAASLFPTTCEEAEHNNKKLKESGMCSIGHVEPFYGALNTWADVKGAVKARSYKGEIILVQDTRLDMAVQWQWRLLRMGYSNTLQLSKGEHACAALRNVYGQHGGCAWWGHSLDHHPAFLAARGGHVGGGGAAGAAGDEAGLGPGLVALFEDMPAYWKYQLAVMILRLGGTNVLVMDSDLVLLDDFYWWMRQPDYTGVNLWTQMDGTGSLNIGVLYARDVAPNGPVTWALAEGIYRNVRWSESTRLLQAANNSNHGCWDQSTVTDAVWSALVGRPIFPRCMDFRHLDRTWSTREDGHKAWLAAHEAIILPALSRKNFSMERPGPACQEGTVGANGLFTQSGTLHMPHTGGEWPAKYGGQLMEAPGPRAKAWLAMMAGSGTPMWPDPEDPTAKDAAAAVKTETFAFFSRHMVCDWSSCGTNGMLMPQAAPGGEPCVVIGHFVVSPDIQLGKRFQLLHNGAFSPQLAVALHGPGGPYLATNTHLHGHSSHAGAMRAGAMAHMGRHGNSLPLPKVLALHPSAYSPYPGPDNSTAASPSGAMYLRTKLQYKEVVEALATVALVADRTVALPKLSCDFAWMHRDPAMGFLYPGKHVVPWRYLEGEVWAPFGPSLDKLGCEWYAWVRHGCLHGPLHKEARGHGHVNPHPAARMILSAEFDVLLDALPAIEREPKPGNVLPLPAGAMAPDEWGIANVTTEALTAALKDVPSEHAIVYVEKPIRVVDLPQVQSLALYQWKATCCGLGYPESLMHSCDNWPY